MRFLRLYAISRASSDDVGLYDTKKYSIWSYGLFRFDLQGNEWTRAETSLRSIVLLYPT